MRNGKGDTHTKCATECMFPKKFLKIIKFLDEICKKDEIQCPHVGSADNIIRIIAKQPPIQGSWANKAKRNSKFFFKFCCTRVHESSEGWDKTWPIWPKPRARKPSLKRKSTLPL